MNRMSRFWVLFAIPLAFCFSLQSQSILNAYGKITAISGSSILTLSNVDQTNHTFTTGEKVIVMQMQDNVIGTNTTNVATFGDIASIGSAGLFEIRTILSRSPAAGTPTTITLSTTLGNTYNTGTNSSVQLISFRNLGTNYSTSSAITGLTWDGNVGGVIALEITNTLTLQHNISADLIGFRLGQKSASAGGGCNPGTYISGTTSEGFKGEGIYKNTNASWTNARAHMANGGGAGNEHNAGGAGGGNYTAGGAGGPGYGCGTPAGGIGGAALSAYIAGGRVFMGGGGGGGGQNNNFASEGANGGGIILIKAGTLITPGGCGTPPVISANGGSAATVGNDGAGGGGAAGTIVLNITTFSVAGTCSLSINADGGNGGSVTDAAQHAGGGGGGQGAVLYSTAQPTTNMQTTTNNGAGGQNSSGGSFAGSGGGTNNSGIVVSVSGPLPVELLDFYYEQRNGAVQLFWVTATEKNSDYFTIERSLDGVHYTELAKKPGAGDSRTRQHYSHEDVNPFTGLNYYRLRQTDRDGASLTFPVISVNIASGTEELVFPNPVDKAGVLTIRSTDLLEISLMDATAREIVHVIPEKAASSVELSLKAFEIRSGIYFLKIRQNGGVLTKKLVVQ